MDKIINNPNIKEYLEKVQENENIELKEAKNALPKEFWQTYSSFSNTNGGIVILGIKEGEIAKSNGEKKPNSIEGVNNPQKVIQEMWNNLSNSEKVSFNNLKNSDVRIISVNGKDIILIQVPEVDLRYKPVYLNGHYKQSFIRKGEGDYKATEEQLKSMLRNSHPIDDTYYIENLSLDALDLIAVTSFKEKVSARYPNSHFETYTPLDFLKRINAVKINNDGSIQIKQGTLLFFGKYEVIREYFQTFFLDYINRPVPEQRWIDRVSSDDINETHMNIYNFFNIVFEKLKAIVVDKFKLKEDSTRVKPSNFDIAIREALTNCLAHADYIQGFPSIKIEASRGYFIFRNPGQMLVPIEQFINGGDSRPRNETIMSFFRYLGMSERQGEGGPSIYQTVRANEYRLPEIKTSLESTELKLWYIDLVESHPDLNEDERNVFNYMYKEGFIAKFKEIQNATGLTEYKLRKALDTLCKKELINIVGNGKSTRYTIKDTSRLLTQIQELFNMLQNEL